MDPTWRIISISKWLIPMVIVGPLSRVNPLPNGHSWLINGGDPNHWNYLGAHPPNMGLFGSSWIESCWWHPTSKVSAVAKWIFEKPWWPTWCSVEAGLVGDGDGFDGVARGKKDWEWCICLLGGSSHLVSGYLPPSYKAIYGLFPCESLGVRCQVARDDCYICLVNEDLFGTLESSKSQG